MSSAPRQHGFRAAGPTRLASALSTETPFRVARWLWPRGPAGAGCRRGDHGLAGASNNGKNTCGCLALTTT